MPNIYDGYNASPEYAMLERQQTLELKQSWATQMKHVAWDIKQSLELSSGLGDTMIGVLHNDGGLAVANSLGVRAGATMVSCFMIRAHNTRLGRHCREFGFKNG